MTPASTRPAFDDLWDYARPDESERRFSAHLDALPAETDPGYRAQLLTQLARAQGLQRRFGEAHATLDEAERLLGEDTLARSRYLLERGRVFNSSGDRSMARPRFLAAWELASQRGHDDLAIDAAHMLGIVKTGEAGLAWNLKAFELAERTPDPHAKRWLGSLANNIGWHYHEAGDYERALGIFRQALTYREQQGKLREIRIARYCVGRALRSLGRLDEALAVQRDALRELELSGESDGYIDEELGECLLALRRADEAREHFARACARLSQDAWLVDREPARLARLRDMSLPD